MSHRDESVEPEGNGAGPANGDGPAEGDSHTEATSSANPGPAGDTQPSEADRLREELQRLEARAREAETRLRGVSKAYTDLESDMDAFRRRMTAQADQRVERKAAELVEQFLEPVQNLRRSVAAAKADPSTIVQGLEMIAHQFGEALNRLGLEELPGVGANFDPAVHEAIAITPVEDASMDGKVVHVHSTGYRVGNRVLQPSQVVIGKHGAAAPEA